MTLDEIANQRSLPQPKEELNTEQLVKLITKLNKENANLSKRIARAEHAEREIANAEHCKNEMWKNYQRMLTEVTKVKLRNDELLADAVAMRGKLREALAKKEIVYRDKIVYQDRIVEKDKIVYKDRPVPATKCEMCSKTAYHEMMTELVSMKKEYEQSKLLAYRCKIFIFFVVIYAVFGLACLILLMIVYFIIIIQMYCKNK